MRGHQAQVEATLHETGELPPSEHVIATWSGFLLGFGTHRMIDASARPAAVLAITDTSIYLISPAGLLHVSFDQLRGPHSPGRDVLRFSVCDPRDEPLVVKMAAKSAHAIARQLTDAIGSPRLINHHHRPRATQRPSVEYVD